MSEAMGIDVQDTSSDEDVAVGETNTRRRALSREERNCLETFCAHPQIGIIRGLDGDDEVGFTFQRRKQHLLTPICTLIQL